MISDVYFSYISQKLNIEVLFYTPRPYSLYYNLLTISIKRGYCQKIATQYGLTRNYISEAFFSLGLNKLF